MAKTHFDFQVAPKHIERSSRAEWCPRFSTLHDSRRIMSLSSTVRDVRSGTVSLGLANRAT